MADGSVVEIVKRYMRALQKEGIHARRVVLFGSFARSDANEWSDIDLIVIAPEFDGIKDRRVIRRMWILRGQANVRIEPIPCGEREWETEQSRPILDIARRDGMEINIAYPE